MSELKHPWVTRTGRSADGEWMAVERVTPRPAPDTEEERDQRRQAFWQHRDTLLPAWAKGLPNRVAHLVLCTLADGEISSLHPQAIRDKGAGWWMRLDGFGRRAEQALGAAIGGWETRPVRIELPSSYTIRRGPTYTAEQLEPLRHAVDEALKALDALKAAIDRLGA